MEKFTFSRPGSNALPTASDESKRAFGLARRARHEAGAGAPPLPEEIIFAAQADLVSAAEAMSFKMKRPYDECATYLQRNDPWLACASAVPSADPEGAARENGIQFE